mmetsp:Transcript_15209/g.45210  ORF Transcript_15209/g.45210 Transcript_15209/m.45210 type:complete len:260 (+) Transcript_15209:1592-2371(+)
MERATRSRSTCFERAGARMVLSLRSGTWRCCITATGLSPCATLGATSSLSLKPGKKQRDGGAAGHWCRWRWILLMKSFLTKPPSTSTKPTLSILPTGWRMWRMSSPQPRPRRTQALHRMPIWRSGCDLWPLKRVPQGLHSCWPSCTRARRSMTTRATFSRRLVTPRPSWRNLYMLRPQPKDTQNPSLRWESGSKVWTASLHKRSSISSSPRRKGSLTHGTNSASRISTERARIETLMRRLQHSKAGQSKAMAAAIGALR